MGNLAKEMREVIAITEKTPGFRVELGNHYKVFCPDGVTILTLSKTPGTQWRITDAKARLTKHGVDFNQGKGKIK